MGRRPLLRSAPANRWATGSSRSGDSREGQKSESPLFSTTQGCRIVVHERLLEGGEPDSSRTEIELARELREVSTGGQAPRVLQVCLGAGFCDDHGDIKESDAPTPESIGNGFRFGIAYADLREADRIDRRSSLETPRRSLPSPSRKGDLSGGLDQDFVSRRIWLPGLCLQGVPVHLRPQRCSGHGLEGAACSSMARLRRFEAHEEQAAFTRLWMSKTSPGLAAEGQRRGSRVHRGGVPPSARRRGTCPEHRPRAILRRRWHADSPYFTKALTSDVQGLQYAPR